MGCFQLVTIFLVVLLLTKSSHEFKLVQHSCTSDDPCNCPNGYSLVEGNCVLTKYNLEKLEHSFENNPEVYDNHKGQEHASISSNNIIDVMIPEQLGRFSDLKPEEDDPLPIFFISEQNLAEIEKNKARRGVRADAETVAAGGAGTDAGSGSTSGAGTAAVGGAGTDAGSGSTSGAGTAAVVGAGTDAGSGSASGAGSEATSGSKIGSSSPSVACDGGKVVDDFCICPAGFHSVEGKCFPLYSIFEDGKRVTVWIGYTGSFWEGIILCQQDGGNITAISTGLRESFISGIGNSAGNDYFTVWTGRVITSSGETKYYSDLKDDEVKDNYYCELNIYYAGEITTKYTSGPSCLEFSLRFRTYQASFLCEYPGSSSSKKSGSSANSESSGSSVNSESSGISTNSESSGSSVNSESSGISANSESSGSSVNSESSGSSANSKSSGSSASSASSRTGVDSASSGSSTNSETSGSSANSVSSGSSANTASSGSSANSASSGSSANSESSGSSANTASSGSSANTASSGSSAKSESQCKMTKRCRCHEGGSTIGSDRSRCFYSYTFLNETSKSFIASTNIQARPHELEKLCKYLNGDVPKFANAKEITKIIPSDTEEPIYLYTLITYDPSKSIFKFPDGSLLEHLDIQYSQSYSENNIDNPCILVKLYRNEVTFIAYPACGRGTSEVPETGVCEFKVKSECDGPCLGGICELSCE